MYARYRVKNKNYTGLIVAETKSHVILLTPKKGYFFKKRFQIARFQEAAGLHWLTDCPLFGYEEEFQKISRLLKPLKLTRSRRTSLVHLLTMESILHQANKWLHLSKVSNESVGTTVQP